MSRVTPHQAQIGFMTIAQNNEDTDYLRLAYLQAMSIKLTMPNSLYAVAVDKITEKELTEKNKKIFDYVVVIEDDRANEQTWKLNNEWQLFDLTPFKETIKVESDLIFTRNITHWISSFRLRDVVLSWGAKNFKLEKSQDRTYRQAFDTNELPDVYNGLMYFRYSQTAWEFFNVARQIYENWDTVVDELVGVSEQATTDLVYALTAKILGPEKTTIPTMDFINFVHMKPRINEWLDGNWTEQVLTELDLPMVRINNVNQYHPLHYQEKTWATDELIKRYENELI